LDLAAVKALFFGREGEFRILLRLAEIEAGARVCGRALPLGAEQRVH